MRMRKCGLIEVLEVSSFPISGPFLFCVEATGQPTSFRTKTVPRKDTGTSTSRVSANSARSIARGFSECSRWLHICFTTARCGCWLGPLEKKAVYQGFLLSVGVFCFTGTVLFCFSELVV